MAYLTEERTKLKKRLKKSKKHSKLVTRRTVILTVARIVGPVERVDQ